LKGFQNGLNAIFFYVATNLLQWFDVFYPQKDKVHWTIEVASLSEKISWWAKLSKNLFEEEGEACTMDGRRRLKPSGPN
jgi:hypothetical protein